MNLIKRHLIALAIAVVAWLLVAACAPVVYANCKLMVAELEYAMLQKRTAPINDAYEAHNARIEAEKAAYFDELRLGDKSYAESEPCEPDAIKAQLRLRTLEGQREFEPTAEWAGTYDGVGGVE